MYRIDDKDPEKFDRALLALKAFDKFAQRQKRFMDKLAQIEKREREKLFEEMFDILEAKKPEGELFIRTEYVNDGVIFIKPPPPNMKKA